MRKMLFGFSIVAVILSTGANCPEPLPSPGDPVEFTNADAIRGGQMYDKWWKVNGADQPTGNHPRYPSAGAKSGNTTWRCKECHGWDYKGAAGAYASGSHFTGIKGLFGTALDAQGVFDAISAHAMPGLSDTDMWDLTKFVLTGAQFDTDTIISGGLFLGDTVTGGSLYVSGISGGLACVACHGADGKQINFHDPSDPEYVGTIAQDNPWEFQHKVRFGQPTTPMPSSVLNGGTDQDVADVGAFAATLPAN